MNILAIDPGPKVSGYYGREHGQPAFAGVMENDDLLVLLRGIHATCNILALEYMEARGMPFGNESLDTVFWTGRFYEAFRGGRHLVRRRDVKIALCGSTRAKDANVAAALRDIYGERDTKKNPNPALRGVTSHAWAALAVWHCVNQPGFLVRA